MTQPRRVIFDIGLHSGNDTAFYLAKGFDVVAVEANPVFVERCRERFKAEIEQGRLEIVDAAIAPKAGTIDFFVNLDEDQWSSIDEKAGSRMGTRAEKITVRAIRFEELAEGREDVYYLKCDIERADIHVLRGLGAFKRLPRFVSVESHTPEYLGPLVTSGYDRFKLINQGTHRWTKLPSPALEGEYAKADFAGETSGPFGEETPGPWLSFEDVMQARTMAMKLKAIYGHLLPGYFDFHAKIASHLDAWS